MATDPMRELAGLLEAEPLLAVHVSADEDLSAPLGALAAAGPRTRADGEAYALIVEAVHEGFLLHYGASRLLGGIEPDLALLAGDHLYALGLDRLAALGDLHAVRELSDLISLGAQVKDGSRTPERAERELAALWTATAAAIAAGASPAFASAKNALREAAPEAAEALEEAAAQTASACGIRHELDHASEAIDFRSVHLSELG